MSNKVCFVCGMESDFTQQGFNYFYECKRCGDYVLPGGDLPQFKENLIPIISGYIRENQSKRQRFQLTQDVIDKLNKIPLPTMNEKIFKIMRWLQEQTNYPGAWINIDTNDTPRDPELIAICYATNNSEVRYFIDYLHKINFITSDASRRQYSITVEGFNYLESQRNLIESNLCFCAMSFGDDHRYIYDKFIQPAVKLAGYEVKRVDEDPHNIGVVDKIFALIRQSKFVIADLSGNKDGVYYEAGFTKGLGREVIFSCEDSDFKRVHFDVQHLNLVKWSQQNIEKAIQDLKWRIEGLFGKGDR